METEVSKDTVSASSETVERLEALARAATPGPWQVVTDLPALAIRSAGRSSIVQTPNQNAWNRYGRSDNWHGVHGEANAAFIAAANPETILALISTLRSQAEALEKAQEAMTASGATKAAYHGEFKFQLTQWREDDDGEPEEYLADITVPWTTVKEIMAAIAARAALTPEVKP